MDVQKVLDYAIFAVLQANSTLRGYGIYNTYPPTVDEVPKDANGRELPFIVFQFGSERIDRTFGRRDFICGYSVKGVAEGRWPMRAAVVSSQIDDVLEGASLTVSGFDHVVCYRTGGFRFPEVVAGKSYTHVGGLYEIQQERAT